MKAYLIDPVVQRVSEVDLDDKDMLAEMHLLIGSDDLDHSTISDKHDTIWVYGRGLLDAKPVWAFKLPVQHEPYAGRALIIGADDRGFTAPPYIPLDIVASDIVWLGEIVPEVVWVEEVGGARAVVTYSRVKA